VAAAGGVTKRNNRQQHQSEIIKHLGEKRQWHNVSNQRSIAASWRQQASAKKHDSISRKQKGIRATGK